MNASRRHEQRFTGLQGDGVEQERGSDAGIPGKVPAIFTTLESTRSDGDVPASNLAAISVTRASIS